MRFVAIVFILLVARTHSLKKVMKFYYNDCLVNPKYVVNLTNSFVQDKSTISIDVEYDLILDVRDLEVHTEIFKFKKKEKQYFVNERFRSCDVFNKMTLPNLNYFTQKILKILRNNTNAFVCFNEPGHYYYTNIKFNYHIFLQFLQQGKYKVGLYTYDRTRKPLAQTSNYTLLFDVVKE
ncbi:hypothetical protein ACFFRR_010916 [Megaselia abdita]